MTWGLWVHEVKDLDLKISRQILDFCQNNHIELCVLRDQHACGLIGAKCMSHEELLSSTGLLFVLGGDGTILAAAREASSRHLPILGVDLGHYGLLSELEPEQLPDALSLLRDGQFHIEERSMLHGVVLDEHDRVLAGADALNDIVVSGQQPVQMIHVRAKAAGETLYQCACDGIVTATPTGSTAYSRSAGGPVLPPSIPCMTMTPLCPSSLASCPMVFSLDEQIELDVVHSEEGALITVDGCPLAVMQDHQRLIITRSGETTAMVRIYNRNFYQRLRDKWDVWAHDQYQ